MKLSLTAFEPNLNDKRVRQRIANVLDWCSVHLSATSPEPVHHDRLREVFGSPGNALTTYLRANLLIKVGVYIVGKQSLSYLLNQAGYEKLQGASQHMVSTSAAPRKVQHPELATLAFDYKLQSDRYWHPLQNIKREKKMEFWCDYLPFNYDIEACAPTILFQCARRADLPVIVLASLQEFLDDRTGLRQHVADLTGMSLADSKQLINSLFNGARLQASYQCAAFRRLNYNRASMAKLQADPQVRALRREIKHVWARLELVERHRQQPTAMEVFEGTAKPFANKLKTGSQKWAYYFGHERRILDAVVDELRRDGIKHFTEHDGFRTDREIDVTRVETAVLNKTGFKIKLSEETCKQRASRLPAYGFYISSDKRQGALQ